MQRKRVLVINGPNLNMLGIREPEQYGYASYDDLVGFIEAAALELDLCVQVFQSNHEGAIVDKIQSAYRTFDGIVINPGAYTHTSIAILDALKSVSLPTVEVHISDVTKREDFRQISYVRLAAIESYVGFGFDGYKMALQRLYDEFGRKAVE